MTKSRLLFMFAAAGLIFALIVGVYVYQTYREPTQNEITAFLTEFTEKIASGDLPAARKMMTEDTRSLLRDPGTALGVSVYRNLSLKSVDHVFTEGEGIYAVDAVMTAPDTMKIMAKAGILFGERITEEGPADDPDQMIASIYDEILSREDLPMMDQFCVVRLEIQNGKLMIRADEQLQQALEGGILPDTDLFSAE